jgi:hypothetical protein
MMDFDEWVRFGFDQGWVGPAVCQTHDGIPMSEAESDEFNFGDPCIHILRLYEDAEQKAAVEAEHAPSVWRASNQGWEK